MVDRQLLLRKLAALDEYLAQLRELRDVTVDQYRADWRTQRAVERTLQLAIEACANVANHMIADRRLRTPVTYAEIFEVLVEARLLDPALLPVLVTMTRFRSLLVHDYARVDPERVLGIVRGHLDGFIRFRAAALKWLEMSEPSGEDGGPGSPPPAGRGSA